MLRRLLVLLAALAVSCAVAQEEEAPSRFGVGVPLSFFQGGQVYCKVSYDTGVAQEVAFRSLCYLERNLIEIAGFRFSVAARVDMTPTLRTTPTVLIDYVDKTWFTGLEVGYSLTNNLGWYSAFYLGLTFPRSSP